MTVSPPALRNQKERDRLAERYIPLVRYVVGRLPVTMPGMLDRDDFFSIGIIGLLHAATTYDPTRGASFKTFAYTAIRGAILDEIRKHDPVPRNRRDRLRKLDRATSLLHSQLGRTPTLEELAEHMEVRVEDLDADLLALHTCRVLSLTDHRWGDGGGFLSVPSQDTLEPLKAAVRNEQVTSLTKAISELPETERHVVVLYHFENLYLREIGEVIGVSESRVSQVLTRATARLRMKLKEEV